jgi:hypothetical protein
MVQLLQYATDTPEMLVLHQLRKIASNSISGVSTFQNANLYCDSIFCNLDLFQPTELF